ncbi:hypothetical protein PVL29_024659 [Vitis rotundifolia]|uniref:Uncharacterized protein n=1 Tax=Vitis rotundifolia TaxID=103349 RepID=A0AA39DB46_VITRO|nr:hypothetical protein PVL29_024659 [Vitis rotundifolia]
MAMDPGDLFPKPLVRMFRISFFFFSSSFLVVSRLPNGGFRFRVWFVVGLIGLLRCGKSCRLRWINYLRPDVKRGNFTIDEDELIIKLHKLLGNKWSLIAGRLPGRTDNEIKNHWNTHIRRRLLRGGIDPKTHQPTKPTTTEEGNCSSALTAATTDGAEKPPQPPPEQQPNQFPDGEEEHINLELTLALFPTPSESTAESKLRRTTAPDGPDEDAGACVGCCQLRNEDSHQCQKCYNQVVNLTL